MDFLKRGGLALIIIPLCHIMIYFPRIYYALEIFQV